MGFFTLLSVSLINVGMGLLQCPGGVTITRQNVHNYSECTSFAGALSISDSNLMSEHLSLPFLSQIDGNFSIRNCYSLSLLRFPLLRVVTGSFIVENVPLINSLLPLNLTEIGGELKIINTGLFSLDGLSQGDWRGPISIELNKNLPSLAPVSFRSIQGHVRIISNDQFSSLLGLQTLSALPYLLIERCPLLTTLEFLPPLANYEGGLLLSFLPALVNISALSQLREVDALNFRGLPMLEDMSPLLGLTQVRSLMISNMDELKVLSGFSANTESFSVAMCPKLTYVSGFANVSKLHFFLLATNPLLTRVDAFENLIEVGEFLMSNNAMLANITGFSKLRKIGNVQIGGNALSDLEFMSGLTTINGSLRLQGSISNYSGLRNLVSIEGTFNLNTDQPDVRGLDSLKRIGGQFILSRGSKLTNVGGFANLEVANGISIIGLKALRDISGFAHLQVASEILITDCPLLHDLTAFSSVTSLQRLHVGGCKNLTSLAGFVHLETVSQALEIGDLSHLQTLDFPALKFVERFSLYELPITNLKGLSSLERVMFLDIHSNPNLTEISGLCNLPYLGGFSIRESPLLCCDSVIRTLSYSRSNLNISHFWDSFGILNCSANCSGVAALSCPCNASRTQCYNGGKCIPTPTSFQCACPTHYSGELCQSAKPLLLSASPNTIDHSGHTVVEIHGARLPTWAKCTFDGVPGGMVFDPPPTPTTAFCEAPPDYRNDSYYADVVVSNQYTSTETSDPRKLVFYTSIVCPIPNFVMRAEQCQTCPTGGWCDDRRVWPRRGYWSENESLDPVKCRLLVACPGAVGELSGYAPSFLTSGERQTQLCAWGYGQVACGKCISDFSQGIFGACIPCLQGSAGVAEITVTIFLAVGFWAVLALAAVTLREETMTITATVLMGVQRALAAGQLAASRYQGDGLNGVLTALTFINLDVQFVKPGCRSAALTFEAVLWLSLVFVALCAVLFVFVAFVRSRMVSTFQLEMFMEEPEQTEEKEESNGHVVELANFPARRPSTELPSPDEVRSRSTTRSLTRQALFRGRALHSLLMLSLLSHFQISLRCFQGLVCDERPVLGGEPAFFLRVAMDTPCYRGPYQGTMFIIWLFIIGFVSGFPLWVMFKGYRSQKQKSSHRYGFMSALKGECLWFCVSAFVVNFFLALFSTVLRVGEVQTFFNALVFLLYVEVLVFFRPVKGLRNVMSIILGMLGLLINAISLSMEVASHDSFFESYLFGLIIAGMSTVCLAYVALKLRAYRLTTKSAI